MATHDTAERSLDRWFARYAADHRHPTSVAIHWLAAPAILWSVVALLWCIPVPGTWFNAGLWAALGSFAAWMFYYRASRSLGLGMLAVLVALAWLTRGLHDWLGTEGLLWVGVAVFVLAWTAQSIGHKLEGGRPSLLGDLKYLLVGPAWLLSKVYGRLGWRY